MKDDEDDEVLAAGTAVGEYRIETLLGRGGMGEVYGAHHPVIGKRVAIKVMNRHCSSNPINVERFVHEAKAVNAIGHSNIVDIFSFGRTADDRCYFVMEWLQGESLRTRLERGRVPAAKAYDILENVLRALEAAHDAGIVHRDLKPDNIFLVAPKGDGEPERIKLLDFGIAKLSTERKGPKTSMTQTGTVVGTPTHMSPEQATGGEIGPATDVYALGVVAFELATGQLPFDAESSVQLMAKHVDHAPPKPSTLAKLSPNFERLILQMLEKSPAVRPSAKEVRERIAKLRTEPAATEPTGESQIVTATRATAPTVAVRKSQPALAVETADTSRDLPAVHATVATTTADAPVHRRRWPLAAVLGGLVVVGIAAVVVLRGGDGAHAKRAPAEPARVETPPTAVETKPAEPPPAAVETNQAPPSAVVEPPPVETRPPKPAVLTKKPAHHAPAAPAVTTPPAQGSAATPPAPPPPAQPPPHDVDAVRDPFAPGGSK